MSKTMTMKVEEPHLSLPTAADVVREGIDAHLRGDYPRLVALTDRRSLERWRKFFVDANTRAPSIEE